MKSLKELAKKTSTTNVKLWGKIYCTERDYYIAEAAHDGGEEPENPPADFEARGSGANKNAYWATNSPLEPWVKLPDLLPSELKASRRNKVQFTGDLER